MKPSKTFSIALAASLLASATPVVRAATQDAPYVSAGVDYSSGKYGLNTSTTIWAAPLILGYSGSAWSVSVTLPYLHVSGPSNVIPGIGVVRNTNPQERGRGSGAGAITIPTTYLSGTASGMGDVVAQATFHAIENKDAGFGLDLTGRVKFGTASADKGLGTGQDDYGAAIDLYKTLGKGWMAFGGVAYTRLGSSSYIQLNDVWSANAGVSYAFNQGDSAGLYLFYQQRPADTSYTRQEATLFYSHRIGDTWTLRGYVLGGFADGSPDHGAGLSVRASF